MPRIDLLVDVVAWKHLLLVEPTADALVLQGVVQLVGEILVGVAVTDEGGVIVNGIGDANVDNVV